VIQCMRGIWISSFVGSYSSSSSSWCSLQEGQEGAYALVGAKTSPRSTVSIIRSALVPNRPTIHTVLTLVPARDMLLITETVRHSARTLHLK
jgi:hypothetical protein